MSLTDLAVCWPETVRLVNHFELQQRTKLPIGLQTEQESLPDRPSSNPGHRHGHPVQVKRRLSLSHWAALGASSALICQPV